MKRVDIINVQIEIDRIVMPTDFIMHDREMRIDGEPVYPFPLFVIIQRINEPVRFEINGRPLDPGCEIYVDDVLMGRQPFDHEFPLLSEERERYVSRYAKEVVEELIRSVGL